MSDVVEDLRLLQSGAQWACGATAETLGQAADEITRLRAERDALKAECYAVGENYEIAKRGQLSAEAERDAAERHADALLRDCAELARSRDVARATLLVAEMKAEIADIEDVVRLVAIGRREGIEAAIVACGAVSAETEGVWANGFTRGVIEAQASVRALLEDGR